MKITRGLLVLAGVVALSACGAFDKFEEVDALNSVSATGSPFTQKLTSEYRDYVNAENSITDHADALHFARKGLASARGDTVMPEPVADWNVTVAEAGEFASARARLVGVFDLGAREMQPDLSAVAQARFDCWIENAEESDTEAASACKNDFMNALNQLEAAMPPPAPAPMPEPAPVASPLDVDASQPMKPENAMYLVFFDWDESTLGPGAQSVLDAVAQEVSGRNISMISVIGHADTSGPDGYNEKLAMRRANAVREALQQRGITAATINVDSRGEKEPLVQTADDVREPANRRAEITFR